MLSLSLLEKAAQVRKEQAAQPRPLLTESDYTITGEGDPAVDAHGAGALSRPRRPRILPRLTSIRDELKAQGIEITDVPGGASWKRV